jgi:hypothetical protein
MRKRRRSAPPKGTVRVRILAKDPLVARRDGLWPVEMEIGCPTPGTGPTGPHAVVVDYNADLDTRFAPAKLLKSGVFDGIAKLSNAKILDDFRFHQVNVWAIVERTLGMIEDKYALARAIPWASKLGRLILLPHAGYQENAFYDRGTGALHFFYFEGPDGRPVYTCLSHDIVAHELGHAVLDGLKPYYNEVCSPETAGFHEYFGDAMSMMASLSTREIARIVTKGGPARLSPRNIVSAIASEFGAALRGMKDEDYLRGAWNNRQMRDLRGTYEEHDWSEVLTGVYYDVLQYLYPRNRWQLEEELGAATSPGKSEYYAMRALNRAATLTAGIMFRALDYCPPVDLRYSEYARAVLRADEVAYPLDDFQIRKALRLIFRKRGLVPPPEDPGQVRRIHRTLLGVDLSDVASTPADAYRFLDEHRRDFQIPYDANFSVPSVYHTSKLAKSGYRPPKEHIIEFVWSEDVKLDGRRFGPLQGNVLPILCGGTIVFDGNGNFLHCSSVPATNRRRKELKDYAAYLVKVGDLTVADGMHGIGAPGTDATRIRATVESGRVRLARNAAMRHTGHGAHS